MICAVITGPSLEEAYQQIEQAKKHAHLVELRLDCLMTRDSASLMQLKSFCSIPVIFTLRSHLYGGNYSKPEEQRLAEIRSFAALMPDYLDLESHISPSFIREIAVQSPQTKLILSYHNFIETPANLDHIYQEMKKIPAFFYKIAVTAKHPSDALRFIRWAMESDNKLIPISMGSHGQISRILSPVIGSPVTYASIEDDYIIAPGQLSAKTLVEKFNYSSLNPQTTLYGLIGDPVEQSISDQTHNHLIQLLGLNALYLKIQVAVSEIGDFLALARQLPFRGLSVTMPLKERIIPYLDDLDCYAAAIGAVNTLVFEGEKIKGYNTDGIGALNAIEKIASIKDKHVVILGAGGAAKAIAYETCQRGGSVTLFSRNIDTAQHLRNCFSYKTKHIEEIVDCARNGYDILVNCTPNPMPIAAEHVLPGSLVMDIQINPLKTSLLKHALEKRCSVIYGYEMFIEQAVGQFALWFNHPLSIPEQKKILQESAEKTLVMQGIY